MFRKKVTRKIINQRIYKKRRRRGFIGDLSTTFLAIVLLFTTLKLQNEVKIQLMLMDEHFLLLLLLLLLHLLKLQNEVEIQLMLMGRISQRDVYFTLSIDDGSILR